MQKQLMKKLNKAIEKTGLTQKYVAAELKVSESTIHRWRNGTATMPADAVNPIVKILNKN